MPEKDPENWKYLLDMLTPEVRAAMLAFITAFLRIMYDKKETKLMRKVLECALCASLAYGIGSGVSLFTDSVGAMMVTGSVVGLMGVDFVREHAGKLIARSSEDRRK